jgi:hypothetical protein
MDYLFLRNDLGTKFILGSFVKNINFLLLSAQFISIIKNNNNNVNMAGKEKLNKKTKAVVILLHMFCCGC